MRDDEIMPLDDWILDDHLDQLSEVDRGRLHALMRDDPEFAARHRRCQSVLEPLDAWTTAPPSAGMVEKILDAIAEEEDAAPVGRDPNFATGSGGYSGQPRFSLRDLIAVAAVIAFFFGVLGPSMTVVRERSRRARCAANLGEIGRGLAFYAQANSGALPLYAAGQGAIPTSFLPVSAGVSPPTATYAPNRRHLFLLVRFRLVRDPQVFACPSDGEPIIPPGRAAGALDDWVERGRCSYDSINASGPVPAFSYRSSQPYMADANPMFVGGRFHRIDPGVTNSRNHRRGAGQNVLFLDGSADWHTTPNVGLKGDNIWQAGSLMEYEGTETQQSADDTFLVP